MKLSISALVSLLPVILIWYGCSDPIQEDANPTLPEQPTTEEPDKYLEALHFTTQTKVPGSLPPISNTAVLKTDSKDTIFTMEDMHLPIRISHPEAVVIAGIFITVNEASYYYDVPKLQEEDSDTVSVIVLSVEAEDIDLPYGIPVTIVPYDLTRTAVDSIGRVLVVEEPSDPCELTVDGDTSDWTAWSVTFDWIWHSSYRLDSTGAPAFVNSQGRVFKSVQSPQGCCLPQPYCPVLVRIPNTNEYEWVYDAQVKAETSYSIYLEAFNFYKNGTFIRYTVEDIKNFNPRNTDWCGEIPGYNERESDVVSFGTHDYRHGNKRLNYVTVRKKCADPYGICGYGSRPGDIERSCHILKITEGVLGGDGGNGKQIRIYLRRDVLFDYVRYLFYT